MVISQEFLITDSKSVKNEIYSKQKLIISLYSRIWEGGGSKNELNMGNKLITLLHITIIHP